MTLLRRVWLLLAEWQEWQFAEREGPDETVARVRALLAREDV